MFEPWSIVNFIRLEEGSEKKSALPLNYSQNIDSKLAKLGY